MSMTLESVIYVCVCVCVCVCDRPGESEIWRRALPADSRTETVWCSRSEWDAVGPPDTEPEIC